LFIKGPVFTAQKHQDPNSPFCFMDETGMPGGWELDTRHRCYYEIRLRPWLA